MMNKVFFTCFLFIPLAFSGKNNMGQLTIPTKKDFSGAWEFAKAEYLERP